jgi:hypothetical protein
VDHLNGHYLEPLTVTRYYRDFETTAAGPEKPAYYSGLDLGQAQDFTALAIVERTRTPDRPGRKIARFDVRHLHRWPLGTGYPAIVADVKAMFAEEALKGSELILDQTGVGRSVVDLFRSSGISASVRAYTITAGESGQGRTVAKKNLVGAVQVPLQEQRLRFVKALPLTPILMRELELFRMKPTIDKNEIESWRERDHDDLVLAVALPLYFASRPPVVFEELCW